MHWRIKRMLNREGGSLLSLLCGCFRENGWWITLLYFARLGAAVVQKKQLSRVIRYAGLGDLLCLAPSLVEMQSRGDQVVLIARSDFVGVMRRVVVRGIVIGRDSPLDAIIQMCPLTVESFQPLNGDEYSPKRQCKAVHLVDSFAVGMSIVPKSRQPRLNVGAAEKRWGRQQIRNRSEKDCIIAIHTGPTWLVREWPENHWRALVALVTKRLSCDVLQLGASQHTAKGQMETVRIPGAIDCLDQFSILETAAILSQCQLLIGIDSGLLHLAGAAGTKTVGIFGAVLGSCRLPVETPSAVVQAKVDCTGCHHLPQQLHWQDGCPFNITCMQQIQPEDVLIAVTKLMISQSKG